MKRKVIAIIQARLGSTRLPRKMLLSLHGHPLIEWVVRRVVRAGKLDAVVLAIPDNPENDMLEMEAKRLGVACFRGSEEDVLHRFAQAAERHEATHVVRVCADNPLICPELIDELVDFYFSAPCDYAYNHIPDGNSFPDGLGAEIVSAELLKRLDEVVVSSEHREHCLSHIHANPAQFVRKTYNPSDSELAKPELRFDVDTYEDFQFLAGKVFDMQVSAKDLIRIFEE